MNEDIFDVLIYLFENYMGVEYDVELDTNNLKSELKQAGFNSNIILKAFDWLESLAIEEESLLEIKENFRIFSHEETEKLNLECRNFILFLCRLDILNALQRELVISRAMALSRKTILLEELQWITLLILLSQAEDEGSIAHLEHILYQETSALLH